MKTGDKPWHPWAAGFVAGGTFAVVGHPLDTIKTRLQGDVGNRLYKSAWHCGVQTVRAEGPRALWRGFGAALLVGTSTSGIVSW